MSKLHTVPGFLGRYAVDAQGGVWSLWRKGRWGGWRDEPYPLAIRLDKNGYEQVGITVDNKSLLFYVHHLVLRTFVGPRPEGKEARHMNGVRHDNRRSNLRWGTALENSRDRKRHGTVPRGSQCSCATTNEDVVAKIKVDLKANISPAEIARKYGVRAALVYNIRYGKAWRHVKV